MERLILMGGIFLMLFILERIMPQVGRNIVGKSHDISNLGLGAVNLLIGRYFALFTVYALAKYLENLEVGVMNMTSFDSKFKLILGVILLDCVNYWWHRLLHRVSFLMRFHSVHHTDRLLNVSSALRFHFFEVLMGHLFKLPFILLMGIPVEALLLYDVIFNINVYFHHSNIRINRSLDLLLSKLIVTPYIHRIHHSLKWKESNSNFSSFLILWDKIFGTFHPQGDISTPKYGIPGYTQDKYQHFSYMMKQPFIEEKS
ncbi:MULTISPECIES: sterol desaturase family protein [Psychrilyobacter]|uniref:Sterol desaturase family protein n=1 Tax=Psychrilyobacter piezotolerans TaxID=2293438 RepID=A0ABX9KHW8_9FUSO|nr:MULTISPECIES: sterol desaturase family protein [Psychrilyobacter]MCS5423149.1 sterol desaturase family protein [Psychrilyobacter sp. S5]NDI77530.1 sterol desaturase family protein [Psychrilyobacter piezotolerans]RDE62958.1 sterol desaturase family protein [Psychrilyobacter sp. S5]REI41716.1 sterol desaturase family protein [Psychrilyobacter piezotolerans]